MRRRSQTHGRTEGGAAAVEFALVVPFLLVIVFGIVNFGFIFAQQLSLSNGARQAARYAVVDGPTCDQIRAEGRNAGATIGMDASAVPVPVVTGCGNGTTKPCAGTTTGTNITVTMTRASPWVVPVPPFNLLTPPTLVGRGIMRCEFS
jgi:Flp pilus assembly protein TadG